MAIEDESRVWNRLPPSQRRSGFCRHACHYRKDGKIREISSGFEFDDIYNCDETDIYLKEPSTLSYTIEELASGTKPERGTGSQVSILFCVNASGSSLARAGTVEALRPVDIDNNKAVTKRYAPASKITNCDAWSLIPYSWSNVKASIVKHYFCKAKVLSQEQVDKLLRDSVKVEEPTPLYPPVADRDASRVKGRYVRLIASIMDGDTIQLFLDKNQ
ncbi:hypothetical protein BGZ88_003144 [Linnemannia elongata]|nr:hypothetical protein BGZ88_003144 [Linnemannia elongata]